jgi:hypothetical protein
MKIAKYALGQVLSTQNFKTIGVIEQIIIKVDKEGMHVAYTISSDGTKYILPEKDAVLLVVA